VGATAPAVAARPRRDWTANPPRTMAELEEMQREQGITPLREAAAAETPEQKLARQAANHGDRFTGGAAGAYNASSAETQAAFDATHRVNQGGFAPAKAGRYAMDAAKLAGRAVIDPYGTAVRAGVDVAGGPGDLAQMASGPVGAVVGGATIAKDAVQAVPTVNPGSVNPSTAGLGGQHANPTGGAPGGAPGTTPGAPGGQPGAAPTPTAPTPGNVPQYVTGDYSRYDAAAADLAQARSVFQDELRRLSGVDPFGNQAFLQKATDRAVAQAAGTAAGAQGGPAALAGAQRGALGVQANLAARGTQEAVQQRTQDELRAAQLRQGAAQGIAGVSGELAKNEIAISDQAARIGETNLQAAMQQYGIDAQIGQQERESLRRLGVEMAQIDMQRYQTDTQYRMNVDDNIIAKYTSDNQLRGVLETLSAQENLSKGDLVMGLLGMGGGLAQAAVMKSDRRSKTAIRPAKTAELREYLTKTGGSHYRYRQPGAPGQRRGENFGPMAQDLAKTKIGRTVVVEKADGLYVDTGRLALADHGALVALAQRVERLAKRTAKK
jgi:hypothetical protein